MDRVSAKRKAAINMSWNMPLFITIGLVVIIAVVLAYGSSRWQSATQTMHAQLAAARHPIDARNYDAKELEGLPAPVQRYFRAVLKDGQAVIAAVSLQQTGTFNMSETGEQWRPFTATQRPGFDWEARIAMLPSLVVRVHDAYIAGEGSLLASLFGVLSLANLGGTPQAAQGELMRFLAEAPWYPTALLPSQGVLWKAVDANSAQATLKDGETVVALVFRFDENGLIESMHAAARGRTVAGTVIPTPWEGRWSHYQRRDAMQIPLEGEVAWVLPEGPKAYWRGRITSLGYDFAQ